MLTHVPQLPVGPARGPENSSWLLASAGLALVVGPWDMACDPPPRLPLPLALPLLGHPPGCSAVCLPCPRSALSDLRRLLLLWSLSLPPLCCFLFLPL